MESAAEFIERKSHQWQAERDRIRRWKDIGREGTHNWIRERLRTNVAKRVRVRESALYLVFKIVQRLGQHWRVLNGGATVMTLVLAGARFVDGVYVPAQEEVSAA